MIISLDFFGLDDGAIFDTKGTHGEYYEISIHSGLIDHLHVDNNTSIDNNTVKTDYFTYETILNARFNGNLEAGSVSSNGEEIEKIRFQKRKTNELYWTDVGELEYDYPNKKLYELLDKYVQSDVEYEYSLLPVTNEVLGGRELSETIKVKFDGYFLSDRYNNYHFLLDTDLGQIEHITNNSIATTLNGRYPIITYGNADYRQGSLQATILTDSGIMSNHISIVDEKVYRDKAMNFIKNRKAKILRGMGSELMMIGIVGNPNEQPNNSIIGLYAISFDYAEIDDINSESLTRNGFLEGLSEV